MWGSLSLGNRNRLLTTSLLIPILASTDASPALCALSTGWDVSWILMLLLMAGQGFTILALSIMLCRQRAQGAQCKGKSLSARGKKRTCGYEAEVWAHILPLCPIFSQGGG